MEIVQSWAENLAALPRNLHQAGINVRLLGHVRAIVEAKFPDNNRVLTLLLLEMMARSLKHILRSRLRRCSANSAGSSRGIRKHAHLHQRDLTVRTYYFGVAHCKVTASVVLCRNKCMRHAVPLVFTG